MILQVILEGIGLGVLLILVCAIGIRKGAVGMVHLYSPEVQERCVTLGLTTHAKIKRNPFARSAVFAISLSVVLIAPLTFSRISRSFFLIPKNSDTLYNAVLPFAFASSTMLFAVDLTCSFTSNTCDFICSHLALSRSCASVNAFFALLIKVSCVLSPQVWQTVPLPPQSSFSQS